MAETTFSTPTALEAAGVHIVRSPADMGARLRAVLG